MGLPRFRPPRRPLAAHRNHGDLQENHLLRWPFPAAADSGRRHRQRRQQTLAQDNQIRAVVFSGEDRLCLDGQRLMSTSGTYGQSGTTYATEIDSFARVTQQGGDLTSAATYFKVEYKSGEMAFFGGNAVAANAARVIPSGRAQSRGQV